MAPRLTHKAEKFCIEFLVDYHPERAALRAGYKPGGPSKDPNAGARGNAHKLLKDRRVISRLSEHKQSFLPEITRKFLLAELYEILTDRTIAPQIRVNAIRETARITGAYSGDEIVPDTINLIIRRGEDDDDGDQPSDSASPMATPSE